MRELLRSSVRPAMTAAATASSQGAGNNPSASHEDTSRRPVTGSNFGTSSTSVEPIVVPSIKMSVCQSEVALRYPVSTLQSTVGQYFYQGNHWNGLQVDGYGVQFTGAYTYSHPSTANTRLQSQRAPGALFHDPRRGVLRSKSAQPTFNAEFRHMIDPAQSVPYAGSELPTSSNTRTQDALWPQDSYQQYSVRSDGQFAGMPSQFPRQGNCLTPTSQTSWAPPASPHFEADPGFAFLYNTSVSASNEAQGLTGTFASPTEWQSHVGEGRSMPYDLWAASGSNISRPASAMPAYYARNNLSNDISMVDDEPLNFREWEDWQSDNSQFASSGVLWPPATRNFLFLMRS